MTVAAKPHEATAGADPGVRSVAARSLDLRLVPVALGLWAASWLATAPAAAASVLAWACAAATLVTGVLVLGAPVPRCALDDAWRGRLALALLAGAAGATVALLHGAVDTAGPLPALADAGRTAELRLHLTGDPRTSTGRVHGDHRSDDLAVVDAVAVAVRADGVPAVTVRTPVVVLAPPRGWLGLLPGQEVAAQGRLSRSAQGDAVLVRVRDPPAAVSPPSFVQRAAGAVRTGLRAATADLPPDPSALLPGLVVGDTSRMPEDLVAAFRTAGLSHLVAVSGGNLAVVVGAVLWLARWCGVRGRWLVALAALAMVAYVIVTRGEPSVMRAAAMATAGLVALATGRPRQGVPVLAAAVIVLLLVDPSLARSYGFALSAFATAGLVVLAPGWARRLGERFVRWPGGRRWGSLAGHALAVPLAAQVAVAPVLVLLDPRVSLVSVPANLLAAPAVAPATVLGLGVAVLATASVPVASLLARVAGLPAALIAGVGRRAAELPGAAVGWPSGLPGALLLAVVLVAVGLGLRSRSAARHRRLRRRDRWRTPARAGAVAATCAGLVVTPVTALVRAGSWPPPDWRIVACDVGQGDALALRAGPHAAVVVDAGPDPDAVDACLRRLDVERVPLLVLTHDHADHVEGLPGVLRGRIVDRVLAGPYGEPQTEAARVRRWLDGADVPASLAVPGQQLTVGDVRLRVLWPERIIDDGSVPNNASVVLRAQVDDVSVLLTGDVEPAAQRALLAGELTDPSVLPVDVLKVPHHGSGNQDPRLLATTGAAVALVSVGLGNDYGHPDPRTVTLLERAGLRVERTDLDGAVAVAGRSGHLRVVELGPAP